MRALLRQMLLAASLGLMSTPGFAAPPPLHGVFVGINHYAHSRQGDPNGRPPANTFNDLTGAVGDVRRFKQTLREVYALDLDRDGGEGCNSANAVSMTLTDQCATRDGIFKAIASQIAAARQGETVLLYFAGHGTREAESTSRRQSSGFNSTFVPYDARDEDQNVFAILDEEFAVFRNRANSRGVNFVMIFDSCHSGTIGRDGTPPNPSVVTASREIPSLSSLDLKAAPPEDEGKLASTYGLPPAIPGITPGYWLSLGASDDNELAREFLGRPDNRPAISSNKLPEWVPGEPAGVFTTALIAAIGKNPGGSYGDFIEDARARILELGITDQNPRADGNFHQRLGGGRTGPLVYPVRRGPGGMLTIASGSLSGITEGSGFAIYASEGEAGDGSAPPRATGRIAKVRPYDADLQLDASATLPSSGLVALETAHNWGAQRITVGFRDALTAADNARLGAMLSPYTYVSRDSPWQAVLNFAAGSRNVELRDAGGLLVGPLGSFDDPGFAARLGDTLKLMLRSRLLLGLRTPTARVLPAICIVASDYLADRCGGQDAGARSTIQVKSGQYKVVVRNRDDAPRRIYVLGVSPDGLKVIPVLPAPGGQDDPIDRNSVIESDRFYFAKPGAWRFMVIASEQPVNVAALEQKGLTARDPARCASNVSRALCAAGAGRVDQGVASGADWAASVTTIKVGP